MLNAYIYTQFVVATCPPPPSILKPEKRKKQKRASLFCCVPVKPSKLEDLGRKKKRTKQEMGGKYVPVDENRENLNKRCEKKTLLVGHSLGRNEKRDKLFYIGLWHRSSLSM